MGAYGLATLVFGLSSWFPLSLAALFVIGAMNNINQVTRQTLMQSYTPDHLRGRASSVNSIFATSSNELGAFECGTVAAFAGPVFAVASGGAITVLAALAVGWKFPQLRELGSLSPSGAGKTA
jgi:predicted MFS family arabinose efflux permease